MKTSKKWSYILSPFLSLLVFLSAAIGPTVLQAGKAMAGNYSWTANGLSGKSIPVVAISPNYAKDKTIFAGTFEKDAGSMYKSVNGGNTWAKVGKGLNGTAVSSIALSPNYAMDKTIFAVTEKGLYKSTDGGERCNIAWRYDDWTVADVVVSPNYADDKTVIISATTFNDVYDSGSLHITASSSLFKSTDGGASWSALKDLGAHFIDTLAFSPNYAKDKTIFTIFARAESGYEDSAVCKSTDGGASWSSIRVLPVIFSLAFSPNYANDKTVFLGGDDFYKSTDGGSSWSAKKCGGYYVRNTVVSPNFKKDQTVIVYTHNGLSGSTDGGSHWNNAGFLDSYMWDHKLAISPNYANDKTVFAGSNNGIRSYTFKDTVLQPYASLSSSDGRFKLVYQGDGNLVLRRKRDNATLWNSKTGGTKPGKAIFQGDGNFVIYDVKGVAKWSSRTGGHPYSHLVVQNDGNVVVYDWNNNPLWATETYGKY